MAERIKVGYCKWCQQTVLLEVRDEFGLLKEKHRCPEVDKIVRYWW